MGGTSFDISLIDKGEPTLVTESHIGGFPLKMPVIDIHTIGAGGGSIAWVDPGASFRSGRRVRARTQALSAMEKEGMNPLSPMRISSLEGSILTFSLEEESD